MKIILWMILGIIAWSLIKAVFRKPSVSKNSPEVNIKTAKTKAKYGLGERRKSRKYANVIKPDVELSEEAKGVLDLFESTDQNIFLTGKAGTGKSTLLQYIRATTKKNIAVLAPTGVAAVNVQGQTIHSFFRFRPGITVDNVKRFYGERAQIYKKLDAVIIDEISMVRADLFDCVEKSLRLNGTDPEKPFGGVQVLAIGDLYQLPPVVTENDQRIFQTIYKSPFFFDAHNFSGANFKISELTHVYRQSDDSFIEVLDVIRTSTATEKHISLINTRVTDGDSVEEHEFHISLVPTNAIANSINENELSKLSGSSRNYSGIVTGEFVDRNLPTSKDLSLKEGAQVMLLNNDPKGKWVNGDIVQVIGLSGSTIRVLFEDGTFDDVAPYKWENIRFVYDEEEGKIKSEVTGSFTQLPVKLAWAVTIHKGQGKTFDKAVVDFGSGMFVPGQAYVALSRCRSLEGLFLKSPLEKDHIFTDDRVMEFMKNSDSSRQLDESKAS